MIPKIEKITPLENYTLDVVFEDGKQVLYDVKEDIETLCDEVYKIDGGKVNKII